jgi:hypothetical protein
VEGVLCFAAFVLFAGPEEEGLRAVLATEALAVLPIGTVLAHRLEAERTLEKSGSFRSLLALEADGHCSGKYIKALKAGQSLFCAADGG